MEVAAIIPARISSRRFPGKVLVKIAGKTMLEHVYQRVKSAKKIEEVYVATADAEVIEAAESFGAKCIPTKRGHPSGTSRTAEAASQIDAEIILNVQADEPLVSSQLLDELVQQMLREREVEVLTPIKKIENKDEIKDQNVVKVVFDRELNALYFSRLPLPYRGKEFYKHIGIYCFRKNFLLNYPRMEISPWEKVEKLEQLSFLWNGCKIKLLLTECESISVDSPQDLEKIRGLL